MNLADYATGAGVLLATYSLNLLYITVFYHRAFTHRAVSLHPAIRGFVIVTSKWITGLDLKAWVCMHRLHHAHADTPQDPHSPRNVGIVGVAGAALASYRRILSGLARHDPHLEAVVPDLEFDVHWLSRRRPYLGSSAHAAIALCLWLGTGTWLAGAMYLLGMSSHPVQGWLVNSLGHAVGYRNFDTPDDSRNNHLAAWLVWGEGLQNNHHAFPGSARFCYHWWEMDFGYVMCRSLEAVNLVRIRHEALMPSPGARAEVVANLDES
jgi:stearoyl-CoA desaturase (delta-9 desaturase)